MEFPDQGGMEEGSEMAAKSSFFLYAEVNFHVMPCLKNSPIQISPRQNKTKEENTETNNNQTDKN